MRELKRLEKFHGSGELRKQNQRDERMPEISRFFGIIVRMYFEDHNPPHVHVEYQGEKALFDFNGNILRGRISSKIAVKLVREWIDVRSDELQNDWDLARSGIPLKKIDPLP